MLQGDVSSVFWYHYSHGPPPGYGQFSAVSGGGSGSFLSGLWEVSRHVRPGPWTRWVLGTLNWPCDHLLPPGTGGLPIWTLLLSTALQGVGWSIPQKIIQIRYQQGKGTKAQDVLLNSDLSPSVWRIYACFPPRDVCISKQRKSGSVPQITKISGECPYHQSSKL